MIARLALGILMLAAASLPASAATLDDFVGIYVGSASDYDGNDLKTGARDIDMIITPHQGRGFKISLVSVLLVDGRRDTRGVRRRAFEAIFTKRDKRALYVSERPYDPFEESKEAELFSGDPLEWAYIEGDSLYVNTLAILADGRYELQVFKRTLVKGGMHVAYQRIRDGVLRRRIDGRLVRVDQ